MMTQTKEQYISPESEEIRIQTESIICASGDPQPYNNPFGGQQNW